MYGLLLYCTPCKTGKYFNIYGIVKVEPDWNYTQWTTALSYCLVLLCQRYLPKFLMIIHTSQFRQDSSLGVTKCTTADYICCALATVVLWRKLEQYHVSSLTVVQHYSCVACWVAGFSQIELSVWYVLTSKAPPSPHRKVRVTPALTSFVLR